MVKFKKQEIFRKKGVGDSDVGTSLPVLSFTSREPHTEVTRKYFLDDILIISERFAQTLTFQVCFFGQLAFDMDVSVPISHFSQCTTRYRDLQPACSNQLK